MRLPIVLFVMVLAGAVLRAVEVPMRLVDDLLAPLTEAGWEQQSYPIGIIDFEKWEWPQGVGLGHLPTEFAAVGQRALGAILARTDDRGQVAGVSYGTGIGPELDFDRRVAICQMASGQSLALRMVCEALTDR